MQHAHLPVLALMCAGSLAAQAGPGKNLTVTVAVESVTRSADTVAVTYRVTNAATSVEPLRLFMVEAPAGVVSVTNPGPQTVWFVSSRYVDRPVAAWRPLDSSLVRAGQTSPPLTFRAVGAPAIVDAHIRGYYPIQELVEDSLVAEEDPMVTRTLHTRVVGVGPINPAATPSALVVRLGAELTAACTLNWITNAGVCRSLQAKLSAALDALGRGQANVARNQLQALLRELDAQRGNQVDVNAYFLLHANAELILERL